MITKPAMVKEWSKIQGIACKHYVGGKSLNEVRDIVARDYGFEASYVRLPWCPYDG